MQACISLQTGNHASTPLLSFFTGRMLFLPPNQQRQSTEGIALKAMKMCRHAASIYHLCLSNFISFVFYHSGLHMNGTFQKAFLNHLG